MQVPKKHFPTVGLVALVLVTATGGSIYYYQFVLPHNATCGVAPVHRVIFLSAIVEENGGFKITGAATINATSLPAPHNQTASSFNFTGIKFNNYTAIDPKSIIANKGDNITLFMFAINSTIPPQYAPVPPAQGLGHGFDVDGYAIPKMRLVTWNTWGATSFTVNDPGTFTYRCAHLCSDKHPSMTGSLVVSGCG